MSLTDKPSADASAPGERRGLEVHGCPIYLYSHSLERSIFNRYALCHTARHLGPKVSDTSAFVRVGLRQ